MRALVLLLGRASSRWLQECSTSEQLFTQAAQAVGPSARNALSSARRSSTDAWSASTSSTCIRDAVQGNHWPNQHEVMHRYCKPFSDCSLCVHRSSILSSSYLSQCQILAR